MASNIVGITKTFEKLRSLSRHWSLSIPPENIGKPARGEKEISFMKWINLFFPNAPFLYPLKTLENLTVFCCFQGVEKFLMFSGRRERVHWEQLG